VEGEAVFQPTSRYYNIETLRVTAADGRVIVYKRRRFLPQIETLPILAEVTVTQGDRLDVITARTLGDAEQFWRVCDANQSLDPFDLTSELGSTLRIPIPQP
jgi:hypothetical protein